MLFAPHDTLIECCVVNPTRIKFRQRFVLITVATAGLLVNTPYGVYGRSHLLYL